MRKGNSENIGKAVHRIVVSGVHEFTGYGKDIMVIDEGSQIVIRNRFTGVLALLNDVTSVEFSDGTV